MKNKVLDFNGKDSRVDVPSLGISPLAEFTIECWVRPTDLQPWRAIRNTTSWARGDVHFQFLLGKLEFSLHSCDPTDQWFSGSFETKKWHHVAVAYNRDAKSVRLYVNGEFIQKKTYKKAIVARFPASTIGSWGKSRNFKGLITELRIWDHARTESQIEESLKIRLSGRETGLVGYWPLNEGKGTVAHDLTAKAKNGKIHKAKWVDITDMSLAPPQGLLQKIGSATGTYLSEVATAVRDSTPNKLPTLPKLPSPGAALKNGLYSGGYYPTYGVVFGAVLLAGLVPGKNAFVKGLQAGAKAAQKQAPKTRKSFSLKNLWGRFGTAGA